jgi:hypothetical protein
MQEKLLKNYHMKDCQILNVFLQSFLKKGKYFVYNKIHKEILSSKFKIL